MNRKINKPFALIIYGPTGVGKTDIALSIGHATPSEIINMDVGQFYTPLAIGTAKPDWQNSTVPHHLFDVIATPYNFTVTEYHEILHQKINEVISRGNLPIVVGGSAFYLKSMLYPPKHHTTIQTDSTPYSSDENAWDRLYAIDPQRALAINKSDFYRINRALQIWHTTGKTPTSVVPTYNPEFDFLLLYAIRTTSQLNDRINQRVIEMLHQGWVEETEKLIGTDWETFLRKKKLIGYTEILDFIGGAKDKKAFMNMATLIQNKTRQYAKRQRTFWRKLERELAREHFCGNDYIGCLESLNLTDTDIHLYINDLLKRLSCRNKKYE